MEKSIDGVKQLFLVCLFAILSTDLVLVHGQSIETFPRNVTSGEGLSTNILCKINRPIVYCRMEILGEPRAVILSNSFESKFPGFKYYGEGLEKGQCGVTIQRVKAANNGPVKCYLGIDGEELQGQVELTVALPPQRPEIKLLTQPTHGNAFDLEQEFRVLCVSRNGRPPAQISWYLEDEHITDGLSSPEVRDVLSSPNTTLYEVYQQFRRHLQPSDDRKFLICRSENQAGHPQEERIQLLVRYRPQPQPDIYVYGVKLGETAFVNVTITSNPRPVTHWAIDGQNIQEGNQFDRYEAHTPIDLGNGTYNVTLSIAGLTVDDTKKTYYLKAFNELGATDYTIHITSAPASSEANIDIGSIVGIVVGIAILLVIVAIIVFARATGKWCFSGASVNTDIGPDSEAQIAPHHDDYDEKEYDHDTEDRHTDTQHTEKNEKTQPQQQQQQQQRNGNEQKTNTPV